jgi:hypothetical protein
MATPVSAWRFEQGRSAYFSIDNLKKAAAIFLKHQGTNISGNLGTEVDRELRSKTGLPYAPTTYRVLRNYGRLYVLTGILSSPSGNISLTRLGERLATEKIDYDEYFRELSDILVFPSPAFSTSYKEFGPNPPKINPIRLLLRCLIDFKYYEQIQESHGLSVDWIWSRLSHRELTGYEEAGFSYYSLREDTPDWLSTKDTSTAKRQIREFLQFISQASFFKFYNSVLYLDTDSREDIDDLLAIFGIGVQTSYKLPDIESGVHVMPTRLDPDEIKIFEGQRKAVVHLRTERSSILRKLYIKNTTNPYFCRMCLIDTSKIHPEVDSLIEVHHLLPLSSYIKNDESGTSLSDVVGLCPNCHRITHRVYNHYLKSKEKDDFVDGDEARNLFERICIDVRKTKSVD